MLAIFKNDIPTNATSYVVFRMAIAFVASIQLYARKRRLDAEKKNLVDAAAASAIVLPEQVNA
jgi:hypothetical protein